TVLVSRVLHVPHQARAVFLVVISPLEAGDFALAPARVDGEPHDVEHGDLGAAVPGGEVVTEAPQLVLGRPAVALLGSADELVLPADDEGRLQLIEAHRDLPDRFGDL